MLSGESIFENKSVLTIYYETKKILIIAKLSINLQTDSKASGLYFKYGYILSTTEPPHCRNLDWIITLTDRNNPKR